MRTTQTSVQQNGQVRYPRIRSDLLPVCHTCDIPYVKTWSELNGSIWTCTNKNFDSNSWINFDQTVRQNLNKMYNIKYLFISLKSKWQKEVNCCIQSMKSGLWIGSKSQMGSIESTGVKSQKGKKVIEGQIKISTIEITKNPTKTAIIFFPGLLILIFSGISSIKTRKMNVPAATQLSEPENIL